MEVSSSEIALLCRRISSATYGYTLSSIYSIRGGVLLRLRHETKEEQFVAVSSFGTWLTSKNFSLEQAESFVTRIRDKLERSRLTSVRMEGNERISTFSFESRSGTKSNLHAEFFGGGNLVVTDDSEKILDVRKAQRFRHRNLVSGEIYVLPPQRGISLESIDESFLIFEFSKATKDQENINAIRWFGRLVGTSRKFVEEIFFRSGVDPTAPIRTLKLQEISALSSSSKELSNEIANSASGFLLLPLNESIRLSVDACPIVPHAWMLSRGSGAAEIREYGSFNESLDQAQVESFLYEKRTKASEETRSKAEELQSAISKQEASIKSNGEVAFALRSLASELMKGAIEVSEQVTKELESLGILERDAILKQRLKFSGEPRTFLDSYAGPKALGSRLYSEAKKLEQLNSDLEEIKIKLLKRKEELMEQSRTSESRAEKRTSVERRARQWYERYRWFLTSDMRLAVGGRDSTSNSVIVNKYVDQNCIVFHADLHGSPFFVLKNAKEDNALKLDQDTAQELAQATASFSRAWRDELGSADAFWVEPDQVKKSAPSGEYLPRGSFFIEGKKNFVKHLPIELGIGLASALVMPREEEKNHEGRDDTLSLVVVCGPPKALLKYCVSLIRIAPGRERSSAIARRIKQLLISNSRNDGGNFRELAKKISVDEIIRSLPSGSYKIVTEKT